MQQQDVPVTASSTRSNPFQGPSCCVGQRASAEQPRPRMSGGSAAASRPRLFRVPQFCAFSFPSSQVNTLAAGAATGMLYRSVRGPRQAAAATVVGTAGAALLLAGRKFINPGL